MPCAVPLSLVTARLVATLRRIESNQAVHRAIEAHGIAVDHLDDLAGRANAAALPYHPRGDGSRAERYSGQHPESEGYARVSRSTSKWNHGRHGDRGIYSNSTPSIVCALKKGGQSWIWCSRF